MKNKHSEIGLMTVILLFVVFAFLMQGRAHGAGPYKVKESQGYVGKYWSIAPSSGVVLMVGSKEMAEDLAYALNRAREERTCKVDDVMLTPHTKTLSVDMGTFYDCKEGLQVTPCTEKGASK